jgi:Zn finger protein HypA/HybF involved in hydrogenase expression
MDETKKILETYDKKKFIDLLMKIMTEELADSIAYNYEKEQGIEKFKIYIYECGCCGKDYPKHMFGLKLKYCPHCGNKLKKNDKRKGCDFKHLQEAAKINGIWI